MTDKERTLKDIISDITEQELDENCPDTEISTEELHRIVKERETVRRKKYFKAAAAVVFVFVCIAAGLAYGNELFCVDADKNGKEEILTDDGVLIEDKGWGSSSEDGLVITDWNEIPIAKSHVEELLIPEYIPEGYEFEELRVKTVSDFATTCIYVFSDKRE